MIVLKTIDETQKLLKSIIKGNKIGFVPTMGALHEGHIALIKRSISENNYTVCSIFVNPTQFNNTNDLAKYPRTLENDCDLLNEAGCDLVFAPSAEEMYSALPLLTMNFGFLESILEGKFRPGHFNGVGIVVGKLFNIVKPTFAYFGMKDIQQVAVIKQMVKDLSFDLKIVPCETIREASGLAMSSRNSRLSSEALIQAPFLYETLNICKNMLLNGISTNEALDKIQNKFNKQKEFKLEYFEIVDFETFKPLMNFEKDRKTAIILAAFLEDVRLIDNIVF